MKGEIFECNLGLNDECVPLRLAVAMVLARVRNTTETS